MIGVPAAENIPGGREAAAEWTDANGNFWLFGGSGCASTSSYTYDFGYLNDLWIFSPVTLQWTWMGGLSTDGAAGVYGTMGVSAPGNIPGARYYASTAIDINGNFWLFGGQGEDINREGGSLNDLWKYSPSTNEWTWIGGSSSVGSTGIIDGVYGAQGVAAAGNHPGGREEANAWTDSSGRFWLFGGLAYDQNGTLGFHNDLWMFDPSSGFWTWEGGEDSTSYGTLGVPAPGNEPGGRIAATRWTPADGNVWLFGGLGFDSAGRSGYLDDLWEDATAPPPAATPTFSVLPGSYTAAQSVSISDSTSGSTIYYTTNGTTPTTGSTVYSGPIIVSSTETIEAIATASGYSASAVASATYTIPQSFALSLSPTSLTVQAGQSATATITVQDEGGFNGNVSFACLGLPTGAACSFALETVPTPAGVTYTTLTVAAGATSAALHRRDSPLFPEAALAVAFCCFGLRKRRGLWFLFLLAASAAGLGLLTACGGSSGGGSSTPPPVTSTVIVTAASGALQNTTTFTLTVN
jgi:hypothetical protein